MVEKCHKLPGQKELEKELSDYLSKKYGRQIKVLTPMRVSQTQEIQESKQESSGVDGIEFGMKPEELEHYLNQYVIRQDEAKAILATKICTHYNRIKFESGKTRSGADRMVGRIKNNIILIGPTGVGKTYLVKLIAQKLGVPFVKGDATKFSETGYVGGDVEDLVRDLVTEANDDLELAEHGIVYIDEIDKIASSRNWVGPDVSRTGVQRALLKPMEEGEVDLKVPHDPVSQLQAIEHYRKTGKREKRTVNTRNILFIMSGAFNDLAAIVKNRLQQQGIGFGARIQSKGTDLKFLKETKAEDLIGYGFESEFIGRIPVIAVLESLEVDDLYQILKNPNNPIILAKKQDFRSYGIDIKFRDDALYLLAQMAHEEKTGARGLVSVVEKVLLRYEKSLPSSQIRHLVVTKEVVSSPQQELARILADPDDPERERLYAAIVEAEKHFLRGQVQENQQHYLKNHPQIFTAARLNLILESHLSMGMAIDSLFEEVIQLYNQIRSFETDFHDEHGLEIRFSEEADSEIMALALQRDTTATAICEEISCDYDYGFKLISDRSGQNRFHLPKKAVVHPALYLEELIREGYRQYPVSPQEFKEA